MNDHEHRYFIFKTQIEYDPISDDDLNGTKYGQLYEKVETATLGCNCGSVIKSIVEQK